MAPSKPPSSVATSMTSPKPSMTPSHLDTVETANGAFHDTAEAFHVTVETFYDTATPPMTTPGGRFEYLTSSRVRQSSSFFTASTKTARRRKQPVSAEEASKPRADSPSRECGRSKRRSTCSLSAQSRKMPAAQDFRGRLARKRPQNLARTHLCENVAEANAKANPSVVLGSQRRPHPLETGRN